MMERSVVLAVLLLPAGCGGQETEGEAPPDPPCAEHEFVTPEGSCLRPGVPLAGCGDGFVHDGIYGCEPLLPAEPCPVGLMAVPGDESCRPIMDCGQGKWGTLPLEPSTQHVDGSTTGSDADGTQARPWPTIDQAVAAAAPGALIAVAAGTYVGGVLIQGKPVRLWGVCPERVTIEATADGVGGWPSVAVCVADGASGTQVGGLTLRGPGLGLIVSGAEDVLVDRVHVHDTGRDGIAAQNTLGPTSLALHGSLVEQSRGFGLFLMGASATVEGSVVRATQPHGITQGFGRGIHAQLVCSNTSTGMACDPTARSTIGVTRSLIEDNLEMGLSVMGSSATVDRSVVRNTWPNTLQLGGIGIGLQLACVETPSGALCDPAARSTGIISRSLIAQSYEEGLAAVGSDLTVEAVVVRDSWPGVSDQRGGIGINVQPDCTTTGSDLSCDPATAATATISRSVVERSHEVGVRILSSSATVTATVVRATAPSSYDGAPVFGDGLAVSADTVATSATLDGLLIADSARAGLGTFGAFVSLANTHIRCAAVELNGELYDGFDFEVADQGGNRCGCPTADGSCKLVSAGLTPPDSLPMGQ